METMKQQIDVTGLLRMYKKLDMQEKKIKLQKDKLKEDVKAFMEANDLEAFEVNEGSLSYSRYVRKSYDTKALEKMFSEKDLEPAKKETEVVSVRITPSKDLVS